MDSTSSRFGWLPPAVVVTVGAAWLAGRDQDVGAVAAEGQEQKDSPTVLP